jgi:predicted MFS family arabinose efflux permease
MPEEKNINNTITITKAMTLLLAIAGGISVANIYYNQPLLSEIAKTFHTTSSSAGLVATFTQLGYALGIFMFATLGDIKEKKKLILTLTGLVTVSLLGVATAQNLLWMNLASFAVGLTSVVPQIISPLAAQLASPKERGKVVGTVVSGLLIGILLSRTVSGFVGQVAGWRAMFVVAAILMFILGIIMYYKLPVTKSTTIDNLTYKELLKSVLSMPRKYPSLMLISISGALLFCAFSVFWTTMIFLVGNPPYSMQSDQAGLFGLLGVAGALGANIIGRLSERKIAKFIGVTCIGITLLSYLIFGLFSINIWGMVIGVILLSLGVQGAQVFYQIKLYSLSDDERSRINTVFVVSNFIGAAAGSTLGAMAWTNYGWNGVCILGITAVLIALWINSRIKS